MILLLIIYLAIGAFIAGWLDEDGGWAAAVALIWPIVVCFALIITILSLPYELGQKMMDFDFKKERKNETN